MPNKYLPFINLLLILLLLDCPYCTAASSSANYILVNHKLNASSAASLSSSLYSNRISAGENLVVQSAGSFYASNAGYITGTGIVSSKFAAADLGGVYVYPNPIKLYSSGGLYQASYLTFKNLPARVTIRIYNISYEEVAVLEKDSSTDECTWNLKNDSGRPVSSGLYIYRITDPSGRKVRGKFAVIR